MKIKTNFFQYTLFLTIFALIILTGSLSAQSPTVGLIKYSEESYNGYTLFSPMSSTMTYLIDNYGRVVHNWGSAYRPNSSVYLLKNGNLMRPVNMPGPDNSTGGIEILDWDGNIIWQFQYSGADFFPHHDLEYLPNGNILMIVRETKTYAEAIAAGRDPALMADVTLQPESIIEIQPTGLTTGEIVWEWHIWDHLVQDFDKTKDNFGVVADHPELLDINFAPSTASNWNHVNSIDYNPELDQIIIGSRLISEMWFIDHSTTTEEAASHSGGLRGRGGDFIYRWGNPQVYDAGTAADQHFYGQHDPHWITPGLPGEGHILVFNNGNGRPEGNYSTIEEFITPLDSSGSYPLPDPGQPFEPASYDWIYQADIPTSFYSAFISGSQRLENGNTLICSGSTGKFFEVTAAGEIVWEYKSPVTIFGIVDQGDYIAQGYNNVFRCYRYGPDYPGLEGRDLTPAGPLEGYPIEITEVSNFPEYPTVSDSIYFTARITGDNAISGAELYVDNGSGFIRYELWDDGLHSDGAINDGLFGAVLAAFQNPATVSYFVYAEDILGSHQNDPYLAPDVAYTFEVEGASYICGDANADLSVNVSDAVYIINFVFSGGAEPLPYESGDTNCDINVNVSDAVYLINYVFSGGNAPCDTNGDDIPDC